MNNIYDITFNIYAKTFHKEYSTPHELHLITSAKRLGERWKLPQRVRSGAPEALALTAFSLTKKCMCKIYWSELLIRSLS